MGGPFRMRRVSVLVVMSLLLTSIIGVSVTQAKQTTDAPFEGGRYIVTFGDEPVASYTGYKKGFAATAPAPGKKLNPNSAAAREWQRHLTAQHNAALASVGAESIYDYTITNNAVAVELTPVQAAKLA